MKFTIYIIVFLVFHRTSAEEQRIINGVIALPSEYPFAVAIIHKAGHCFVVAHVLNSTILLPAEEFQLSVGSNRWIEGAKYRVEQILVHPNFVHMYLHNDIAVARSATKVKLNDKVQWVSLNPRNLMEDYVSVIGIAMGWGFTNEGYHLKPEVSDILRSVTLHSIPWSRCKNIKRYITKDNICMTGAKKGTCTGDSGGPLVQKFGKLYSQIGIISYGTDCNNTTPEVYTRIAPFYNWITTIVRLPHPLTGYN